METGKKRLFGSKAKSGTLLLLLALVLVSCVVHPRIAMAEQKADESGLVALGSVGREGMTTLVDDGVSTSEVPSPDENVIVANEESSAGSESNEIVPEELSSSERWPVSTMCTTV